MRTFDPQNMALSHSRLSDLWVSPNYFRHKVITKTKPTDAMVIGSMLGCSLLEEDKFGSRYTVFREGFDLRSNDRKKEWQDCIDAGMTPIKHEMAQTVAAMKKALLANETARLVLRMEYEGLNEMKLEWVDKRTGLKMKGFVDRFVSPKKDLIIDAKTGADVSPQKFKRSFFDMDYDQQAALYFDGLSAMGHTPKGVAYIAVESTPPYDVGVFNVPADVLLFGRQKYERRLDFFIKCRDENLWDKSYDVFSESGIHDITIPKWLTN